MRYTTVSFYTTTFNMNVHPYLKGNVKREKLSNKNISSLYIMFVSSLTLSNCHKMQQRVKESFDCRQINY